MNELTYIDEGDFSYWSYHDYYENILPKISQFMTDDEKFLVSIHDRQQLLYCADIEHLNIDFDTKQGTISISIVFVSYRFRIKVLYEGITAFQFGYGEDYGTYSEIYKTFISHGSSKRHYFLSHFQPIKDTKFDFIEYKSLKIISKEFYDV